MNYFEELLEAYELMVKRKHRVSYISEQGDRGNVPVEDALKEFDKAVADAQSLSTSAQPRPDGTYAKPRGGANYVSYTNSEKGPVFTPSGGQYVHGLGSGERNHTSLQKLQQRADFETVKITIGYALLGIIKNAEDITGETIQQGKTQKQQAAGRDKKFDQQELEKRQADLYQQYMEQQQFEASHEKEILNNINDLTTNAISVFSSSEFHNIWDDEIKKLNEALSSTSDENTIAEIQAQKLALTDIRDRFHGLKDKSIVDGLISMQKGATKHSIVTKLAHPKYFLKLDQTESGFTITNAEKTPNEVDKYLRESASKSLQALGQAVKKLQKGEPVDFDSKIYLHHIQFTEDGETVRIVPTTGSMQGLILGDLDKNHPLAILAKTYNALIDRIQDPSQKEEMLKHKVVFRGISSDLVKSEGKTDSQLHKHIGTFCEKICTVSIPFFAQLRKSSTLAEKEKIYSDIFRRVKVIRTEFKQDVLTDVTKTLLRHGVGNVSLSDEVHQFYQELKQYSKKQAGLYSEADVENMLDQVVMTALKLNSLTYQQNRFPIDAFTVGERASVNAKKPDQIEMYSSEEELTASLVRSGVPLKLATKLVLPRKLIGDSYLGGEDRIRNQEARVMLAVGLKNYLTLEGGVKFGTTMASVYLANNPNTSPFVKNIGAQFDRFKDMLSALQPSDENEIDPISGKPKTKLSKASIQKITKGIKEQLDGKRFKDLLGGEPTDDQLKLYKELTDSIEKADSIPAVKQLVSDIQHNLLVDRLKILHSTKRSQYVNEVTNMFKASSYAPDFDMVSEIQVLSGKSPRSITVSHNHLIDHYLNLVQNNPKDYEFTPGKTGGFTLYKNVIGKDKKGKKVKKKIKMGKLYLKREGSGTQIQSYFSEQGLNTYMKESPDYQNMDESKRVMIEFLSGQKKLLDDLLSRYQ